jgi:chaperonin GroEL
LRAQKAVDALKLEGDRAMGAQIVRRALEEPVRIISSNAGFEASVIVNDIRSKSPDQVGFDAKHGEFVDMIEKGIIDPAKVTRTALQNAASISGLMLTTEAMVTELPEEKSDKAPAHPGMGGMAGMPGMY